MTMTQGIMVGGMGGDIRLGNLDVIMDFLSNPNEYEPDLSEVKEVINNKKPVEIVRKPVVKPKLTKEGLINKYSLVNVQREVKTDNVINDDVIVNETDDFDFGNMDFEFETETTSFEDKQGIDTKDTNIDKEEHEIINGIEFDLDEYTLEEDTFDEDTLEDDLESLMDIEDEDTDDIEVDIDDTEIDIDDIDDIGVNKTSIKTEPSNKVINGIEFEDDIEDFDDYCEDDDIEEYVSNSHTSSKNNMINIKETSKKEEINGIEIDTDLDDLDDIDAEDVVESNTQTVNKEQSNKQVIPENKMSNTSTTSFVSSDKENLLEDIDDSDLDGLLDDIEDDDEDTEIINTTVNNSNKSNNEELLQELNRLKAENERLKHNSEAAKNKTEPVKKIEPVKKAEPVKQVVQTRHIESKALDKNVNSTTEVSGSKYDKYTVMNINALYANVSRYMVSKGVQHKPIDIKELNDKFGADNIKKLIVKQYLIKTKKGVTVGL